MRHVPADPVEVGRAARQPGEGLGHAHVRRALTCGTPIARGRSHPRRTAVAGALEPVHPALAPIEGNLRPTPWRRKRPPRSRARSPPRRRRSISAAVHERAAMPSFLAAPRTQGRLRLVGRMCASYAGRSAGAGRQRGARGGGRRRPPPQARQRVDRARRSRVRDAPRSGGGRRSNCRCSRPRRARWPPRTRSPTRTRAGASHVQVDVGGASARRVRTAPRSCPARRRCRSRAPRRR